MRNGFCRAQENASVVTEDEEENEDEKANGG
jgi:hypothetical protein